jgi:benzoyl-CoA reductase/2-hydroxyglutaryl-CoA dehydratase subunit BcrC/BadD/HgdB
MDEILAGLRDISSNPQKQLERFISEGKKVSAVCRAFARRSSCTPPAWSPSALWGAEMQAPEAKRYWPAFICSILQTTLELGIRGAYDGLAAVMIPILCDSLKGMDGNWRYAVPNVPVIPVAHAQNRKTASGVEFTASQYRRIRARLEELAGAVITDAAITDAVGIFNERRAAMRRFAEAACRHPGLIKPSDRNAVYKSGYFMDVKAHLALVSELAEWIETQSPTAFNGPRVVTSGVIADSTALLQILDACGVAVVRDAVTHESIRYNTDVPKTDDPVVGMAQQIGEIEGCPMLFDPEKYRGTMLMELVKDSGADGVLFTQTKFCDPEEYDYVPLKRMLDATGIPSLQVETDQQTANYEQARTAIETFCELLRYQEKRPPTP